MNGKIYVYFNKRKYEQDNVKKYYVGQTRRTLKLRAGINGQGYHKYDKNLTSKFANAIRKWGWDSFEGFIVADNIESQDELNKLEIFYIELYDSFYNGYNSTKGGDGVTGCNHTGMYGKEFTEEHRKKLSESHIGIQSGENHPMYGRKHTEESKTLIREARKKQNGENHPMYGKKHTMETRLKHGIPIYCDELDMIFQSITLAYEYSAKNNFKAGRENIIANCKGRRNHAGFVIVNGEKIKLHWSYIEMNGTPTTTERKDPAKGMQQSALTL